MCIRDSIKLLRRDIIFYFAEDGLLGDPITYPCGEREFDEECVSENERAVASWVLKNNKHAGVTTATLANAKCLYLAVRVGSRVYGVAGIVMGEMELDSFENSIMLSILGECALGLENEQTAFEKEQAAILAKNEQLRACLLYTSIDKDEQMNWKKYALCVVFFSLFGFIFLFLLQLLQGVLPGNPQNLPGVSWHLSFNTTASFVTNTNWQAYTGESTLSYLDVYKRQGSQDTKHIVEPRSLLLIPFH